MHAPSTVWYVSTYLHFPTVYTVQQKVISKKLGGAYMIPFQEALCSWRSHGTNREQKNVPDSIRKQNLLEKCDFSLFTISISHVLGSLFCMVASYSYFYLTVSVVFLSCACVCCSVTVLT